MVTALWVSFGLVFVVEMGDRSQFIALAFTSVPRWWQMIVGILLTRLVVHAGSVALG